MRIFASPYRRKGHHRNTRNNYLMPTEEKTSTVMMMISRISVKNIGFTKEEVAAGAEAKVENVAENVELPAIEGVMVHVKNHELATALTFVMTMIWDQGHHHHTLEGEGLGEGHLHNIIMTNGMAPTAQEATFEEDDRLQVVGTAVAETDIMGGTIHLPQRIIILEMHQAPMDRLMTDHLFFLLRERTDIPIKVWTAIETETVHHEEDEEEEGAVVHIQIDISAAFTESMVTDIKMRNPTYFKIQWTEGNALFSKVGNYTRTIIVFRLRENYRPL